MFALIIDKNDFTRGISITPDHDDGGYSPAVLGVGVNLFSAIGVNLNKKKGGVLYPQPARFDVNADNSAVIDELIIAFAADPTYLGNEAYMLDDSGNFYTLDSGTVTKRQTDSTNTFTTGTSDMITYNGALFATSTAQITKLQGSDLSSIDATWWTVTAGGSALSTSYRHPMEVVEDTLYIADKNDIHTWDGSAGVDAAMSLPSMYNITNMIIHTDGRHLLVFVGGTANYSHTLNAPARCFIIDTLNLEFVREIEIHSQIEGSINVGGVIYVTYGNKLGYFNGDGITFLRDLHSDTSYKHTMTNYEGILCIRDKNGILLYGDLGLGNVFWYQYADERVSNVPEFTSIFYNGSDELLTSISSRKLDSLDLLGVDGESEWESNHYSFPSKVWIRKIELETETLASGSDITLSSLDKNDVASTMMTMTFSADGAIDYKEKFVNIRTSLFKLRADFAAGNTKGIRKVSIWYEDAE